MLKILIHDCRVSLVPKELRTKRKIREYINKHGRPPLLDASEHQYLMKDIPLVERKDRPDILHFGLLLALNYAKTFDFETEILFSIGKKIYSVEPETRLPRSQKRFYSILEQVLLGKYKAKFIKEVEGSINDIFSKNVFIFSRGGNLDFRKIKLDPIEKDISLVFGGMAHGEINLSDFVNPICVNLGKKPLELWTAMGIAISQL